MKAIVRLLGKVGLFREGLDYQLLRGAMVIMYFFFGYQKWFEYEAKALIPFISNSPLVSWLYLVFGIRGACWFLGVSEWTFGGLILLGYWNKKLGAFGAAGSVFTFLATVSIIPFIPNGWEASAGGFPAMTINTAFLMKDVVLLAVSLYLLKQDALRGWRVGAEAGVSQMKSASVFGVRN
jgi:uncharacterized membrane protein YkgB